MSKSERRIKTGLLPSIRCHTEDEQTIRNNAKLSGLSVGAYLLSCGLNKKISSRVDQKMISELSKLGGLQKHLFLESNKGNSVEYSKILGNINKLILKISDDL